jgi:hypothetical protein
MRPLKIFISFDYDDHDVKAAFAEQAGRPDFPVDLIDVSIQERVQHGWPEVAEKLIRGADVVLVLCGEQTHQAKGVTTELQSAQNWDKKYILVSATRKGVPTKPANARATDKIWRGTWATVGALLRGETPPANAVVR